MGLKIKTTKRKHLLKIDGELTLYMAAEYKEALMGKYLPDRNLEVDLSKVVDIDTGGLQLLIALGKQTLGGGHNLKIISTSEAASEAMTLNRFCDVFPCESESKSDRKSK